MNNIVCVLLVALLSYGVVKFLFLDNKETTNNNYAPIVQLNNGKVRGRVLEVGDGNKLFFYEGIRFGKAARFEAPKPVEPWTGVYDALTSRSACPQPLLQNEFAKKAQNENMSEDCLYLNVWRPTEELHRKRSVMVFIHGGAFAIGTIFCPFTDARYIAGGGDVIVVAVNYRLGPFGFLHGGDVHGNMGLLDQVLGLDWVQENIEQFGGDPSEVTIFGASAGSISVGSLILSPLTKGLFKRAILQSGTPNSHFGATSSKVAIEKTKQFALKLNCPTEDIKNSIECLKSKSTDELVSKINFDFVKDEFFTPVYGDQVLPTAPNEALRAGKFNLGLDIMYGVTKNEGSGFAAEIFPKLVVGSDNLTIDSIKEDIVYMMNTVYRQTNGDEVATFYTDKLVKPTEDDLKTTISNVWGDYHLICPTLLFVEQIAKHKPNNHYYAFRLMQSLSTFPIPKWMGTTHAQDSYYLFRNRLVTSQEDLQLTSEMIRTFTHFAKNGNPGKLGINVQWEEAFDHNTNEEPITKFMFLKVDDYKMVSDSYKEVCEFWKEKIAQ